MLPRFPDANGDEEGMLREMAVAGFEKRIAKIPDQKKGEYRARLATELDILCAQGFAGYFLIVADFIGWSKAQGIPVGPGRGSVPGSEVAWALGISDLDPPRWAYPFERLLHTHRGRLHPFSHNYS